MSHFFLILSFIFFSHFSQAGELSHLGLQGLEPLAQRKTYRGTIYFGAMSNSSPTTESTQVTAMELTLSWTLSQVNSGSRLIISSSVPSGLGDCHDFRQFSLLFFLFFLSPKRPLIQLRSTMTCFHIPYLILSHVPFLLSYLSSSFGHFG